MNKSLSLSRSDTHASQPIGINTHRRMMPMELEQNTLGQIGRSSKLNHRRRRLHKHQRAIIECM